MNPIEILRPDLLVLVLIPVVVLLFRSRFWRRSMEHPLADRLAGFGFRKPPYWLYIPRLIEWVIILLLVGVFIQPVLPIGQRQTTVRALDLVLCVDLSASMQKSVEDPSTVSAAADSGLTRLEAVKQVALDFIRSRAQDRIGLVVFSANAYLVNPLTTDHQVLSEYIQMVDGNTLIGEGLTSVGEGLRLSNDLLSFFGADEEREGKAIIVFTDAEQNYGLRPNRPLERARRNKTRVYFVGVGVPIESVLGALTSVVRETGGDYFDALHVEELREVSLQIDRLERNPVEVTEYLRNQALSLPLLIAAGFLLLVGCALRAFPRFYVTG
jgi:Ca-activated chloride channel family protein